MTFAETMREVAETTGQNIRFIEISGRSFPARVKEKFHLNEDLRFYGSE